MAIEQLIPQSDCPQYYILEQIDKLLIRQDERVINFLFLTLNRFPIVNQLELRRLNSVLQWILASCFCALSLCAVQFVIDKFSFSPLDLGVTIMSSCALTAFFKCTKNILLEKPWRNPVSYFQMLIHELIRKCNDFNFLIEELRLVAELRFSSGEDLEQQIEEYRTLRYSIFSEAEKIRFQIEKFELA